MNCKCETIIFSDKAYNAIIRESFSKHPLETGGKLLGYISADGKIWFVMEALSAGINATHQVAHFQYDKEFIDYLSTSIANQYQASLQDLGLWHRHPGSMDTFSSTDDITNVEHASRNPYGIISGLVNIDPKFRLTIYYLNHQSINANQRILYSKVTDILVGDAYIPKEFFALRYVDPENIELHPLPPASMRPIQQQDLQNIDEFNNNPRKPLPPQDPTIRKTILFSGLAIILAVVFFIIGSYTKEKEITKLTEENTKLDRQLNNSTEKANNLTQLHQSVIKHKDSIDKLKEENTELHRQLKECTNTDKPTEKDTKPNQQSKNTASTNKTRTTASTKPTNE